MINLTIMLPTEFKAGAGAGASSVSQSSSETRRKVKYLVRDTKFSETNESHKYDRSKRKSDDQEGQGAAKRPKIKPVDKNTQLGIDKGFYFSFPRNEIEDLEILISGKL
ncbi:MAG: hypothetical protein H0W88_10970 [Parachlamydiaceae bacterium]|nr:hypothetical protein [Parachlamydiaceae bacterium]